MLAFVRGQHWRHSPRGLCTAVWPRIMRACVIVLQMLVLTLLRFCTGLQAFLTILPGSCP
jgi:hypothetical protein